MKPARAIASVLTAASLILAACGNAVTAAPSPSPTSPLPTWTRFSSPTSTPSPVPTSTATPIPCDLSSVDYCIKDAYFVFQRPIAPPGTDSIDRGYPFGSTEGGTREPHHGVEFYNASGTPVLAAADGVVSFAGNDTDQLFTPWSNFYGNLVVLKHELPGTPYGILYTLYAHLSKLEVTTGQTVTAGQKIGEVGATGAARGSHLHFEVRVDPNDYGSTLNPELWLVPHPGNGTLALLARDNAGTTILPTFNVQYYPDRNQPATAAYQVDAFAAEMVNASDPWGEIAAIGDQPAGLYRVTSLWAGVLYEKWVEIQPEKLTLAEFIVK